MKIDRDMLHKIAHLARIAIKPEEEERLVKEMTSIVSFMEKLNEVNTDGVEPLTTMTQEVNSLREDEVKGHLDHEAALRNAPSYDKDHFRVPKVLE